nr:LTA synthase family protein [Actinomycetales bacterium]
MASTTMPRAPVHAREAPHGGARLVMPALLVTAVLWWETILRIQAVAPFLNSGLLYMVLFGVSAALVVFVVASLLQRTARHMLVGAFLAALTAIYGSQFLYYDIFGSYYTVFSAAQGGKAAEFMGVVVVKVGENWPALILLLLPLVLFLVLPKRAAWARSRFSWRDRGIAAGLAAALFGAALAGVAFGDRGRGGPHDMYFTNNEPVGSVNQLGLFTAMRLDLQRFLFGFEPEVAPPPPVASPLPTTGPTPAATSPDEGAKPPSSPVETAEPVTYGPNALEIDFAALAEAEPDEQLRNMHTYFGSLTPSSKNEHTGMFEGYNLVFITAEAYSHYAVDPELTPTLYKMVHGGFEFTNFYNPIWGVSTSDGEYVATTGLIPKAGVWSMWKSGSNSMPFAMGNQLRGLGYTTKAYHNHTYDYYGRDTSHPNLGYDYKGVGNGLVVTNTWPESDLEMVDVTTAEYLESEPFHAYYMTVSGHLLYNFGGNAMAQKNRDLVENLPYNLGGRAYLATQIELDRALELLMERLEEAGVAERTLIVLSADHYPYGLEKRDLDDLAGQVVDTRFELHRSSLIIYAQGMEPEVVEEPVSSLDIIPTLSNLMGLEFDSRLLMGRDVFAGTEPLVILNDRSFLTGLGRYDAVARSFTPNEGVEVPEDHVQRIADEIDRRFYYSSLILDRDYYGIVVP